MIRSLFVAFAVALIVSMTACAGSPDAANLSPAQADSLIRASTKDTAFRLVDVRTPQEYQSGKLAGSTLIDFHSPDFAANIAKLPRNAKILVYCRSGNRSGQALTQMQSMGFTNVKHVVGGINAWRAQGLPVAP